MGVWGPNSFHQAWQQMSFQARTYSYNLVSTDNSSPDLLSPFSAYVYTRKLERRILMSILKGKFVETNVSPDMNIIQ